jgi:hypothetical protein
MFVASIESKDGGYISYSIKLEKKGLAIAATDGQDAFYKLSTTLESLFHCLLC